MENYPDRISPQTLAAAMALGSGGGDTPSAKVYYPAGSVPFLGLPALSENKIGAVYDVTDEFTSTEDFTDGGGKKYSAGTNVAIVNVGTEVSPVLKYDCMMGDLSEILGVIPSTATTQNKLATAADVTGEDISATATGTSITLTDSADGYLQGVTVKGRSEKSRNLFAPNNVYLGYCASGVIVSGSHARIAYAYCEPNTTYTVQKVQSARFGVSETTELPTDGVSYTVLADDNTATHQTVVTGATAKYIIVNCYNSSADTLTPEEVLGSIQIEVGSTATSYEPFGIKTIGDDGFTITTVNSDSTETSTATITTGLPLRSVSDSIYDTLDNEKVIKKCAEVDLGDLTWAYNSEYQFFATTQAVPYAPTPIANGYDAVCSDYQITHLTATTMPDKTILVFSTNQSTTVSGLVVKDTSYTDATTFKTAVTGVKLVYPLATPTETPLTSAEKSALASLRTYDHTTHIDATDAPTMTVDYLLNTNNGKAVADIQRDLQGQINGLAIKTLTYTGTGTATNNITFTEKPTLVLSIQITNKDPLNAACMPFRYGSPSMFCTYTDSQAPSTWRGTYTSRLTYSADELTMTITGTDKGSAWNDETTNYTLYYV